MEFSGTECVITGAASGIGRSLAMALAAHNANVHISDRNVGGVNAVAAEINALSGGQAFATELDVTDASAFAGYLSGIAQNRGHINLMINNAGIAIAGDARDLDIDHWRRVLEVNLMGVINGATAAYKLMARQGHGHIVNISSLSGLIPFPTNIPYGTSKFAVVGFSAGLRTEGEALGVRVSAVCPGFIESNIYSASESINTQTKLDGDDIPFKKVPAAEAAQKILRGIQKNQAMIVFPGYAKVFWWLYRLHPALLAGMGRRFINDFRKIRHPDNPGGNS